MAGRLGVVALGDPKGEEQGRGSAYHVNVMREDPSSLEVS